MSRSVCRRRSLASRDTLFAGQMRARFGDVLRNDVPLAPLTTFKVGGPAEWLIETR